jgi:hypothetical protein
MIMIVVNTLLAAVFGGLFGAVLDVAECPKMRPTNLKGWAILVVAGCLMAALCIVFLLRGFIALWGAYVPI